ncbi:unnamed protein product [Enterobius vermicularis]|uniref:ANK_REP_REGION domain-containing protein n=1 Tax=Enterobius vermicularis TaxID=51028 RepID=A0A0N4VD90_ENTVE|nr:unnamed protein product [Enterobius vermicularis]
MPQQNAIVFDWLNGAEDIDKVEAFYKFRISSEHSPQNSAIFSYQFQLEYFPSYCLKKWKRMSLEVCLMKGINGATGRCKIDHQMWTPLHWAAEEGHTEMMKRLFGNGANLDTTDMDEAFR